MKQIITAILVALVTMIVVAQEKPKPVKHAQEIVALRAEIDSIRSLVPDLQKFYNDQFTAHLNRLQGRIDERSERIAKLQADTVEVKKK